MSTSLFINAIPYYLLALLAYLYLVQGLGLFPETGYHSPITDGPAKFVAGHGAAVDHDRHRLLHAVRPVQPRRHDRLPQRGLRAHRARQGPDRAHGRPTARAARRHRARSSPSSASTSPTCWPAPIFTEKIFGIQGMGLAGLDAVQRTDLPMVSAVHPHQRRFIVVANIVVDILYSVIDPRVRLS